MPTVLDLVYVALFAVAWPICDHVAWPAQLRRLHQAPHRGRLQLYRVTLGVQWLLAALGTALWMREERPWSLLGVRALGGWRLATSLVLIGLLAALHVRNAVVAARRPRARAHARRILGPLAPMLPHTGDEFGWFLVVSLTAGVCEELLFRGYFPWALAPWLGWWGAAVLGAVPFGLLHAYQGRDGVLRTASLGLAMTVVVTVTRSVVPAVALHVLLDASAGLLAWVALRNVAPHGTDAAVVA